MMLSSVFSTQPYWYNKARFLSVLAQKWQGTDLDSVQMLMLESKGGLNVISQAEWDEIRVIADKCPLTDGQAVYEAMSLLHLLEEEVEIHEDCAPSVPRTALKSTPELVKMYPNPGKGLFTFEIPKKIEADQCVILDVTGRTIKQFSVQKNVESFQVDLSSVKPGVYLYVFKNNDTFVQQGKLIVIE
jgi:hypothetical protein